MRRTPLLLLVLALLATGCGGGGDRRDAPTTSTTRRSPTSTTAAPTTTLGPAPCAAVTVPAEATEVVRSSGDVDGDGRADDLVSYRTQPADWHLQAVLAAGGGADLVLTSSPDADVAVLGGADVDGDGADEVWATTGSGASATIVGLARFARCGLERVTFAAGGPAELTVGGTVGTATGLECAGRVDPTADLTAFVASNVGDDRYEVRATEYALEGAVLAELGTTSSTVAASDDAFARATSFACHGLGL